MPVSFEQMMAVEVRKLLAIKVPLAMKDRLSFKILPDQNTNEILVKYEREGPITGVMATRGLGGSTRPVLLPGFSTFEVGPAFYGEHFDMTEQKLLQTRKIGDWMKSQSFKEQMGRGTDFLTERLRNRGEKNRWDLLQNGVHYADDGAGNVQAKTLYDIQELTPAVPWTTYATATPLQDMRRWMMQLRFGKSLTYSDGEIWMNGNTVNEMLANTNPADLGGRRAELGQTINNQKDLETIFIGNDLPRIRRVDDDWIDDNGTPNYYLGNGKLVLIGKRLDGQILGYNMLCPSIQNQGKPGYWITVTDKTQEEGMYIRTAHGANMVCVLEYPELVGRATAY